MLTDRKMPAWVMVAMMVIVSLILAEVVGDGAVAWLIRAIMALRSL